MTLTVDVVIPCYNYARYLSQCVDSVLRQAKVAVRILIIDDASSDDSEVVGRKLADGDPRVHYRRHENNAGHIATYNEGIDWASADYFLLLSADDYLLAGALHRAVALMESSPAIGLTFGRAFMHSEDNARHRIIPIKTRNENIVLSGPDFIRRTGASNIVPTPSAVIRTALQKRVGGYRSDLPHTGDLEMWLRLGAHGSVGYINEYQAVYRQHGQNMSKGYSPVKDIEHRRAALSIFAQSCGHRFPAIAAIRREQMRQLARGAVRSASGAFNRHDPEVMAQLLAMAVELHPGVMWTAPWWRLVTKRQLISVARWVRSARQLLISTTARRPS